MGSFNVACSISKISISGGTPVAFIPLEVTKYPSYKIGDCNHMLIYSHCFYAPVTLPIFGEYDDYGGIEYLIRDKNLEIVEEHFGKTIKEIRDVNNLGRPVSSGMFIHREIFDCMIRDMQIDEFGNHIIQRAKRISDLYKYFNNIRKAKKKRDQHIRWEEEYKNCGRQSVRFETTDKTIYTGTHFNGLFKTKYKGLRGNQRKIITQPPFLHQNAKPNLKLLKDLDSSKGYFTKLENHLSNVYSAFKFRDYKTFNEIYQPVLYNYDPTKQDNSFFTALIDFAIFEDSLYATNNFYFPAMNGYQCGHKYASEVLYNKAKEIMLSEISEDVEREKEWKKYQRMLKEKKRNEK